MTLTYEKVCKKVSSLGFSVTDIDWDKKVVYMVCSKGHKYSRILYEISKSQCQICQGKLYDLDKVKVQLENEGYTIIEEPELSEDKYGNFIVKANTGVLTLCPEGHEYSVRMTDFNKGKRCTTCSKTIFNTGFSRSEEIIDRVLTYNGVLFERQHPIEVKQEKLALDFYLPEHKIIIEYDGAHHKYGRTGTTEEQLRDIKRRDELRDEYARFIGFRMIRIDHDYGGKALVYKLAQELSGYIDIDTLDPYYDEIVKDVFNECSKRFSWITYDEMKEHADVYLHNSIYKASEITGVSPTVIARRFRWVYGMGKREYLKSVHNTKVAR